MCPFSEHKRENQWTGQSLFQSKKGECTRTILRPIVLTEQCKYIMFGQLPSPLSNDPSADNQSQDKGGFSPTSHNSQYSELIYQSKVIIQSKEPITYSQHYNHPNVNINCHCQQIVST